MGVYNYNSQTIIEKKLWYNLIVHSRQHITEATELFDKVYLVTE